MFPMIDKLASEVTKVIEKPAQAMLTQATTEGIKAVGKSATNRLKSSIPLTQRVAEFKERNVVNSDDIAYACALVDILYRNILGIRINNVPLRSASSPDVSSVPAAFLFFGIEAVKVEDRNLHGIVQKLRIARAAFSDIFPACVLAITGKEYMDLKSLASKFSSIVIADGMLVKEALETCRNGVAVCDKGLSWSNAYDKTLDQWLVAGKAKHVG